MPLIALISASSCAVPEGNPSGSVADGPNTSNFVSLNPCLDAILIEVADPQQILALSHYSHDPRATSIPLEKARKFAITGGSVEEILSLKPHHVLASSFLAPATKNALENLGHSPHSFGIAADVQTSVKQIRRIADLAGHKARGEALIARIDAALETGNRVGNANTLSAVLWQPGQIVPGDTTMISELMTASGFTNHTSDNGMAQADFLSLESLLVNPPDVLLIAGEASSKSHGGNDEENWNQNHAQNHKVLNQMVDTHIASFDPSLLYCAGPTIIRAVERFEAIRVEAERAVAGGAI